MKYICHPRPYMLETVCAECRHHVPHVRDESCVGEAGGGRCRPCVPVRAKRKARASGLPTSAGNWRWKPSVAAQTLVLWVCPNYGTDEHGHMLRVPLPAQEWSVGVPVPTPDYEAGFVIHFTGRTVGNIGGVWGTKIEEPNPC